MTHHDVLALILGGGRGTRLWPLTKLRAKPAVPIGGKYRLVDITLSNCLNSGIQQIAILTQFNSVSLHRHISRTYHFDFFHPGWVQILAAEQTFTSADWYQGTADAVRKQLFEIQVTGARDVLILAGDHLYRMDYSPLIAAHRRLGADVTLGVIPVSAADAPRFGILKLDAEGWISDFIEKPTHPKELAPFALDGDPQRPYLGSMGIYLFRMPSLCQLLEDTAYTDFGSDVIPAAIRSFRVHGYRFDGYWEDVGTIRAFYHANLAMAQPKPAFTFHEPGHPVYTRPRFLPGSRIYDVQLDRVLLSDGCVVEGARIRNAVIGIRSIIEDDVVIEDTVMMGADYYEDREAVRRNGGLPIGIGRGARIKGAIIDKNARIGAGVRIEPFPPEANLAHENWEVKDGLVVVPKNATIPAGAVIAP